jgi:hypothetical protein
VSGEHLDLARRLIEAFATRDVETFEAYCDPQIEIQPAITRVEGTAFRGARAYHRFLEQIDEAWESLEGSSSGARRSMTIAWWPALGCALAAAAAACRSIRRWFGS